MKRTPKEIHLKCDYYINQAKEESSNKKVYGSFDYMFNHYYLHLLFEVNNEIKERIVEFDNNTNEYIQNLIYYQKTIPKLYKLLS